MNADILTADANSHRRSPADTAHPRGRHWGGPVVGGFYLVMGGIHVGLVAADTDVYRHFADAAFFSFVRTGWHDVFMAQPAVFGLLLAAGEIGLGVLLLVGGRAAIVGWAGVVIFHLLLMLFGFGIWVWCLPALAVLVYLARRDAQARATAAIDVAEERKVGFDVDDEVGGDRAVDGDPRRRGGSSRRGVGDGEGGAATAMERAALHKR